MVAIEDFFNRQGKRYMVLWFKNDYTTGCEKDLLEYVGQVTSLPRVAYGEDDVSLDLQDFFSEFFETKVSVYIMSSGTACNALSLSYYAGGGDTIICHARSHVELNECGAIEFHTGGAKLDLNHGKNGKFDIKQLKQRLQQTSIFTGHNSVPKICSIANLTEAGTAYTPDELDEIGKILADYNLKFHIDGARFVNALEATGASPSDLTWKRGVNVMSLGMTKNGALTGEVVIFFDEVDRNRVKSCQKRFGQVLAKSTFVSAQFKWLFLHDKHRQYPCHSRKMAKVIAARLKLKNNVELMYPVEGNIIYFRLASHKTSQLRKAGVIFGSDPLIEDNGETIVDEARIVTSFATTEQEVSDLLAIIDTVFDES